MSESKLRTQSTDFAVSIINLVKYLKGKRESIISNQIGRSAPLKRNITIIEYSDVVLAFWDGKSHGTKYVIDKCKKRNIPIRVFTPIMNNIVSK